MAEAGHDMRDQEVLRANRELAAYFRGGRTEREARAALKIIKAFIRDRERADAKTRRPLPGMVPNPVVKRVKASKPPVARKPASRKRRRSAAKTQTMRIREQESPDGAMLAPDDTL